MLAFHGRGQGPIVFEAGGGVKHGVPAHAAVDCINASHELLAAGGVAGVKEIALVLGVGRWFSEHDAAFAVTDAGTENAAQGFAGVMDKLGRVSGRVSIGLVGSDTIYFFLKRKF